MLLDETALIANAIYIYLILVFGSVILGAVGVTVRGFVKRSWLSEYHTEKHLQVLDSDPVAGAVLKTQSKSVSPNKNIDPREPQGIVVRKRFFSRWRTRSEFPAAVEELPPQDVGEEGSSSATANVGRQSNATLISYPIRLKPTRRRYSMETLMSMNSDITQLTFKPDEVRLSVLLWPNIPLPQSRITSKYAMDQELELARLLIEDLQLANKCIGFFRIACAASFGKPYSNVQHFHKGFAVFMTSVIDSLDIFFMTSPNPSLQLALLDLAYTLLWEHWNWEDGLRLLVSEKLARNIIVSAGDTAGTVTIQEAIVRDTFDRNKTTELAAYDMIKLYEPEILPELTVFRLFCNLYLGTTLMSKPVRNRCVFKLSAIFYCCASRTKCNSHIGLAKILEQALDSSSRDSQKAFFYDVLKKLLQPHVNCCIRLDDIFANGSVIQKLIFQGLWTDQPATVREKAQDVVVVLSERFNDIVSWNRSMKFTHLSDEHRAGRSGAPGSWRNYK